MGEFVEAGRPSAGPRLVEFAREGSVSSTAANRGHNGRARFFFVSALSSMELSFLLDVTYLESGAGGAMQMVCGESQAVRASGGQCGAAAVGSETAGAPSRWQRTPSEQKAVSGDPGRPDSSLIQSSGHGGGSRAAGAGGQGGQRGRNSAAACALERRIQTGRAGRAWGGGAVAGGACSVLPVE